MLFYKIKKFFIFIFLSFLSVCRNSTPFFYNQIHIDFWFQSESYYNFVRIVNIPEKKSTFFLFFYPESFAEPYSKLNSTVEEEELKKQSLSKKISIFSSITNKNPDLSISLDKHSLIRLINFTEGINVFLPIGLNFQEADYYYNVGFHKLFGENIYEFIFLLETDQQETEEYLKLHRHYRWQTFVLNFFYQIKLKPKLLHQKNQMKYLHSLMNTNTSVDDLNTILLSITESKFFLIELPLIAFNLSQNKPVYVLNFEKAKELYHSYISDLKNVETKKNSVFLEIINANGTDRLANRVKMRIHSDQFKVLHTDNFSTTIPRTILLCNNLKGKDLEKIQNLMSLNEDQIYFYRTLKEIPFTLILGEDFSIKNLLKK